jgi:hypothetical protein
VLGESQDAKPISRKRRPVVLSGEKLFQPISGILNERFASIQVAIKKDVNVDTNVRDHFEFSFESQSKLRFDCLLGHPYFVCGEIVIFLRCLDGFAHSSVMIGVGVLNAFSPDGVEYRAFREFFDHFSRDIFWFDGDALRQGRFAPKQRREQAA